VTDCRCEDRAAVVFLSTFGSTFDGEGHYLCAAAVVDSEEGGRDPSESKANFPLHTPPDFVCYLLHHFLYFGSY
jgi:hypothetical protein